jgi:hypothetical protein
MHERSAPDLFNTKIYSPYFVLIFKEQIINYR